MKSAIVSIAKLFLVCSEATLVAAKEEFHPNLPFDRAFAAARQELSGVRPGHSLMLVEAGDKCEDESIALGNDSGLVAAVNGMTQCPPSKSGSNTFTVDYSSCPASGPYGIACTAIGGKSRTLPTIRIVCEYQGERAAGRGRRQFKATMLYENIPLCIGQSCEDSAEVEFEAAMNEYVTLAEAGFADQGTDATCVAGASSLVLSKIAIASGFLALTMNLFF